MKKLILCVMAVLAGLSCTAAALQRSQQSFSEKLVRLHVVANSDSEHDQAIKLRVRDAVLEAAQGMEKKEDIAERLPQIEQAAEQCLRSMNCKDPVRVTVQKERFPTRVYETFSLPAGVYTALRVTIGEGAGHNWWCVVFPSICMPAAADLEEAALTGGFTEDEIGLITEENEGYVLKFKAVEWIEKLKEHIWE